MLILLTGYEISHLAETDSTPQYHIGNTECVLMLINDVFILETVCIDNHFLEQKNASQKTKERQLDQFPNCKSFYADCGDSY